MRSLSNSLTAAEVRWPQAPEPEPAPITPFNLACELTADLETYREMLSIQIGKTLGLTHEVERQRTRIIALRTRNAELRTQLDETTHALAMKDAV